MKKWKKLLASMLVIALVLSCMPGYEMEVKAAASGDYKYHVNEDEKSVTITRYKGKGGDVRIPKIVIVWKT